LAKTYRLTGDFRRLYHYHIRKTGGTSLNHMFLSLGGRPGQEVYAETCQEPYRPVVVSDKIFLGWNQTLIERGDYFYAYSHMPAHRLKLPPKTFTVTCLRDPVARVVSLYTMIKGYRNEPVLDRRRQEQVQWLGSTFEDFVANLPKRELLNQIYMFSETFDLNEAFDTISSCAYCFFTEESVKGVEDLETKLRLGLKPLHIRRSQTHYEIEPAELERLRARLEPEYQLYARLRNAS
jgi:hypothetical protein